jgi:SAM-dependent methyltransferase
MNARIEDFATLRSRPQLSETAPRARLQSRAHEGATLGLPLMDPKLQRRAQRSGWDLAAGEYESLWQAQLAPVRRALLAGARVRAGEQVLDVACGTGLVTFEAARATQAAGWVLGTDLSPHMVRSGRQSAARRGVTNVGFERMDAERLVLPDGAFDLVLCSLGLMYVPDPRRALSEARRVLRPGGRVALAVWGEHERCGWSGLFPVMLAEVAGEVSPFFFRLGEPGALADLCRAGGLREVREQRLAATLVYEDERQACAAAFSDGGVALAWSRFDQPTRARVAARYLRSIEPWRRGEGFRIPAEFVIVQALG